ESVFDLVNTMWWGVTLGILMISVLTRIPREFVMSILGTSRGLSGILRATSAGVLLDLCSHGILMVGAKLYERGASIGQVIAFLVASPWNSFSLTLILIAMVGLWWTLGFIVLSMVIAIITGLIFDALVTKGILPDNPSQINLPADFRFWRNARQEFQQTRFTPGYIFTMLKDGIKESRMVIRWILFGIMLAGLVRAFLSPETFGTYFGPTLAGLGLTVLIATIMEVCSEGSTPIAADLLTRANAPGNGFAFLMTGVSTDYTEIMVLKETTGSWKIALFLPLLTVPQVLAVAWLLNGI
ncbi:permease, partial [Gammaproteobacteria bacterium]|nr:permease [Gammaproteobacteria bacterium]